MRNIKIGVFASLLLLLVACNSNQPVGKDGKVYRSAIEYNDAIIKNQVGFANNYLSVLNKHQVLSEQTLEDLKKLSSEAALSSKMIESMPAYKGDSSFRDAGVELLNFYSDFLLDEFSTIVKLRMLAGDSLTHQYTDSINMLTAKVKKQEVELDEKFQRSQKAFAQKNGFRLDPEKSQEMLKKRRE